MAAREALLTVPQSLERAAGGTAGITYLREKGDEQYSPYSAVLHLANQVAAGFLLRGLRKGDRVALILPSEEEFATTFLGVLIAGGVAVPMAPPLGMGKVGAFLESTERTLMVSAARFLVTSKSVRALIGTLRERVGSLQGVLLASELAMDETGPNPPNVSLDDLAMLQFTSGSTSHPKGVMLTHGNLAANCWAVNVDGLRTTPADRCVSWLPLFHDMGLIGFILCPMYGGISTTLMPPALFATRPAAWLRTLSAHKGTITYAPNFAYAYAAKRIRDADLENVDLSHVRVMGCGAEPINAETLRTFARRFEKFGFRDAAFYPSYGMAESSVAISFGRGVSTDRVHSADLETTGRAVPTGATSSDSARELVACGGPFVGHQLEVVDTASGASLEERMVGEIRISGPSITSGYFNAPEASAALFDERGWLRTGDLGYLADGQLYVCGRIKDLIIVRGRNCAPHDLEWQAAAVDGVRAGAVVAFSVPGKAGDTEAVIIVAEAKRDADRSAVADAIRTKLFDELGLTMSAVEIVEPGTLPKTTSGKLQRSEVRRRFLDGTLRAPRPEGMPSTLKHLVASQWGHFKSAIGTRVTPKTGS